MSSPNRQAPAHSQLLQFCVLRFGFSQDGGVGVGVFPQRKEVLVSCNCPHAGGIGVRALRSLGLQSIGACHAQMRQRSRPAVPDYAAVVEDFLKLGRRRAALVPLQDFDVESINPRRIRGLVGNLRPTLSTQSGHARSPIAYNQPERC